MRKKILFLVFPLFTMYVSKSHAQVDLPFFGKQQLVSGYASTISGENISYFSVFPKYAKQALLTRCTDGKKAIEWTTDVIPKNTTGPYVYFSWIAAHSTGSSGGNRNFDLYINNAYALSFTAYKNEYKSIWKFYGTDSTCILFELKTRDGAGDAHGMAYLRVPLEKYKPGESLKLKIVGHAQESNDWFMTFQYKFRENVEATVLPFLLRENGGKFQPLQIDALHFGAPALLKVYVGVRPPHEFIVKNGFNSFQLPIQSVATTTTLTLIAEITGLYEHRLLVEQNPVVYREIQLVHHSHTDIGYSHSQEDVEKIHVNNIYQALYMIDKTKKYPTESRFKWNIESSWAAENFLKQANEKDRMKIVRALQSQSIALAGTYANELTGLSTPEEIGWNYDYSYKLAKKYKFQTKTGMITDIPGMSWSAVTAMAQHGIRYFSDGPNYMDNMPDKGDRIGHTIKAHGDKPFWWKSSNGKDSVLFWVTGKGYSSWHGFAPGSIAERGAEKIATYMNELQSNNYPYSLVQWRYNIVSDNGPIDSTISDFVRNWNKKYSSPKLVLANVNQLYEKFERRYGRTLPVLSGDFTGYWEDGAYSTAKEENKARELSSKIIALEKMAAIQKIQFPNEWWYNAKKWVLLFQEHTWGSWNSISDPDNSFSTHQWDVKKNYLDSLGFYVSLLEKNILNKETRGMVIKVQNCLPWKRSSYVKITMNKLIAYGTLINEQGKPIQVQQLSDGQIIFYAKDIPANGYALYKWVNPNGRVDRNPEKSIELKINESTGAIAGVYFNHTQWVNPAKWGGLLQALYVKGLDPLAVKMSSFEKIEWIENGPLYRKSKITAALEGTQKIEYWVEEFVGLPQLKITAVIDKLPVREKESLHLAFPFQLQEAVLRIGIDSTYFTPEAGQLAGANKDFYCAQRWLDVSDSNRGVTIVSPQVSLYESENLIDERKLLNGYKEWKSVGRSSANIFAYVMNNYWHTNYKADQEGITKFEFMLHFHEAFNLLDAVHFGYENTEPLFVSWIK